MNEPPEERAARHEIPGPPPKETASAEGSGTHPGTARWWGWGEMDRRFPAERLARIRTFLHHRLGVPREGAGGPPPSLHAWKIPPSRVSPELVSRLRDSLPQGAVSAEGEERLLHSFGRAYMDLLALRHGQIQHLTDLVAHPASIPEILATLRFAEENDLAVVPWGGGTSVVGGVAPTEDSHHGVITLSMGRFTDPISLDLPSRLARFQCGIRGPELESYLSARGTTLGHFPQSFEYSTLGGWLSTRSSGQASTRYGDPSHRLRGAKVVTPRGVVSWEQGVAGASGPDLSGIFLGNEGTLGIFAEATMAVDLAPAASWITVLLFPDWYAGVEAIRTLAQSAPTPAILRLSDREETELTMEGRAPAAGLGGKIRDRLGPRILELRKMDPESLCLAVVGYEGTEGEVRRGFEVLKDVCRAAGAVDLGRPAGEAWRAERFLLPFLRDDLLTDGWLVETLETGASWTDIGPLAHAVQEALQAAARKEKFPLFVGTHLSHAVPEGSGLYFSLIAPQFPHREEQQWTALKEAATGALLRSGGLLSHHHGIGGLHRPWMRSARGEISLGALEALKAYFDPHRIMNPGKLLP